MKFVFLVHAVSSCWNNGNAHFQRGVMSALVELGHEVVALEPRDGWSRTNLIALHGLQEIKRFRQTFPGLDCRGYATADDIEADVSTADVVVVHESTAPEVVARVRELKARGGKFLALYHDTHHRAVSDPGYWSQTSLEWFDGVLAFGESLAQVYRSRGWGRDVFVWHEAADERMFRPQQDAEPGGDLVFIGNWGDEERSAEIAHYLLAPAFRLGASLDVFGVRYPEGALETLRQHQARYHGWIANAAAPAELARHRATVHVPRRYYAEILPGIPTIRVFEALACGVPLLSAPWHDSEGLFRVGDDFLMAANPADMARHMRDVLHDSGLRAHLAASGLARIRDRHTCRHRALQLIDIVTRSVAPVLIEAG